MTLTERLEQIAKMTAELAQLTEELHKEIDDAINHPEWLLPEEINETNNEPKNNSTEDTKGRQGEEPEATVL